MIDWFRANLLTINLDKTECILFHNSNSNNTPKFELELGDCKISNIDQVKFLGLWIDRKLQWNMHTNTLLMKLKQNTNLLKVGNKFLNKACKKMICPHLQSHHLWHISLGEYDRQCNQEQNTKVYGCLLYSSITPIPNPLELQKRKNAKIK